MTMESAKTAKDCYGKHDIQYNYSVDVFEPNNIHGYSKDK
jgi:hypothetical protein